MPFVVLVKKERKKTHNPREGWENGTPPPHRDFKEYLPSVVRGNSVLFCLNSFAVCGIAVLRESLSNGVG